MSDPYTNRIVRHHLTGTAALISSASPRGFAGYLLHGQLASGLPVDWPSEEVEIIGPDAARSMLRSVDGDALTRVPPRLPALRAEHPVGGGSAA